MSYKAGCLHPKLLITPTEEDIAYIFHTREIAGWCEDEVGTWCDEIKNQTKYFWIFYLDEQLTRPVGTNSFSVEDEKMGEHVLGSKEDKICCMLHTFIDP